MSNLLPPAAKKHMHTEYIMRVVIVALYCISFIALGVAALSVPSALLMQSKLAAIASDYELTQQAEVSFTEAEATITDVNTFIENVASMYNQTPLVPLVEEVLALRSESIVLSGVEIDRNDELVPETMMVSGNAVTRSALQDFAAVVEALEVVDTVDLPIESLAKETEVPFRLTITLKTPSV